VYFNALSLLAPNLFEGGCRNDRLINLNQKARKQTYGPIVKKD
jgi:hypothetical protein